MKRTAFWAFAIFSGLFLLLSGFILLQEKVSGQAYKSAFAAFGWTVFQMSFSHFLLTAAGFVFFSYKASREESWLTELHPEYSDYAHHVRKFIPWIY